MPTAEQHLVAREQREGASFPLVLWWKVCGFIVEIRRGKKKHVERYATERKAVYRPATRR